MKIKIYILLLIHIFIASCNSTDKKEGDYEKIYHINKIDLSRELLRPSLFCIIDSVVVLHDNVTSKDALFFAFNLITGDEYAKFGIIGSGPFDYNYPVQMNYNSKDKKIWVFDRNYSKLYGYNLYDIINNQIDSILQIKIPSEASRVVLENESSGYCLGNFLTDGMIGKIINGKITKTFGYFPEIKDDKLTSTQKFGLFQGDIKINQNKIVYTSARCDLIKIFHILKDSLIEVKTQYSYLPKYIQGNDNYLTLLPENPNGYISVSVSNNYILALFSGRNKKEYEDRHYFGDIIHIFNWEGEIIKKVILNKDAWQIFFNENTNKLYTVHFNLDESEDDTNVQYYEYDLKII